jgi:hypothetical protein
MVADAVRIVLADFPPPNTGSFRGDCEAYLGNIAAVLSNPQSLAVVAQLVNEGARDPDLATALRSRLIAPRRRELLAIIDRACANGQLPAGTDRDALADLLVAPLYDRALISGEPMTEDIAHRIVTAALDGH